VKLLGINYVLSVLICLIRRILFVEEYASVLQLMVCNSKGMVTATVNVSVHVIFD